VFVSTAGASAKVDARPYIWFESSAEPCIAAAGDQGIAIARLFLVENELQDGGWCCHSGTCAIGEASLTS
jgi:hypothetical protein